MEHFYDIIYKLIFPNPFSVFGLSGLIFLDLFTGIFKSSMMGIATRSQGMKKSVLKFNTYFSMILLSFILTNLANLVYGLEDEIEALNLGLNGVCLWLIHLEVKSILENLILANTDANGVQNQFAKTLTPIHNAWILKFKNMQDFNYMESKKDLVRKLKD